MKNVNKKSIIKILLAGLAVCMLLISAGMETEAATTGYTDHIHAWKTPSKCSTCDGDHLVTCDTCGGDGIKTTTDMTSVAGSGKTVNGKLCTRATTDFFCTDCGGKGSRTNYYYDASTNGIGAWTLAGTITNSGNTIGTGTEDCSRCYASGTYKGKNTLCTYCKENRNGTSGYPYYYYAWSAYPNGVCYTTENTYTIAFNGNGATGGSMTSLTGVKYTESKQLTANGYSKTGYTFLGWSTTSTATSASYANGASVSKLSATNGDTVTLYAVWALKTHTLAYDANGGTGAPASQTVTYGTDAYVSSGIPTRIGYTFKYWTSSTYDTMYKELTWTNNSYLQKAYIENYWYNGKFYITIYIKGASGYYISLPTWTTNNGQDDLTWHPTWTTGWTINGETYNYAYSIPVSEHKYEIGDTCTHVYVYSDSAKTNQVNVSGISTYGATFCPGDLYPAIKDGGTQTLYAQWTPNEYELTFVPNGGTFMNSEGEKIENVTMTYDTQNYWAMNWGTAERKGYTFKGWYTQIEGGVQVYDAENKATNEGTYFLNNTWIYPDDVTLYAQWEAIPRTITYDANQGITETREVIQYYQDVVDLSLTAERPGYIFVGWNTDAAAKSGLTQLMVEEADITLYAIYSIQVSDIANHFYDENDNHIYTSEKEQEVFLKVWEVGNAKNNYKDCPLSYEYDTNTMVYRYGIDEDIADFFVGNATYGYAIYVYDNAGNWSVITSGYVNSDKSDEPDAPEPIVVESYRQTVEHYRYDCVHDTDIHFATTVEVVQENSLYKPAYLTDVTGYEADKMEYPSGYTIASDGSYAVTEAATTKAYYKPKEYTLSFNANGGTPNKNATIQYGEYYGNHMYTPTRTGYTFIGWYTQKSGGEIVKSSDKYLEETDMTLYAHWSINSYTVTYDYWTNGGSGVSLSTETYAYGAAIDMTPTAVKAGWTHIGWNTNPDATTALTSYKIGAEDTTLYAIYKKDITATFIDSYPAQQTQKKITLYNRQESGDITIPAQMAITGWKARGWTTSAIANASAGYSEGAVCTLSDDITFYGLYEQTLSLTYDTNGSAQSYPEDTGIRYYNAYGNWENPTFVAATAPMLEQKSFVNWDVSGTAYNNMGEKITQCSPEDEITLESNVVLKAVWDAFPEIEAYDRYVTLEQAQNGFLTETELLRKVKATDEEAKEANNPEGLLENGTDVVVLNFADEIFRTLTSDAQVDVTYMVKDDFGNTVTKTVTIYITDTTMKEVSKKYYVRFINRSFFENDEGALVAESKGGLEDSSIWRVNETYRKLLRDTLSNMKQDSGEWIRQKGTWTFTKQELEAIKKKL